MYYYASVGDIQQLSRLLAEGTPTTYRDQVRAHPSAAASSAPAATRVRAHLSNAVHALDLSCQLSARAFDHAHTPLSHVFTGTFLVVSIF